MAKLTDEMKEMVNNYQAFVATVSNDGRPNIGPKRSTRVLDDETLMFSEVTGGQTYRNIRENGLVSVAVVNQEIMDGFRFTGRAEAVESGPLYEAVAERSQQAGFPQPVAAIKIRVEEIYTLKPPRGGTRLA